MCVPEKVAAYTDSDAFWLAASKSFARKAFEAIVADTVSDCTSRSYDWVTGW